MRAPAPRSQQPIHMINKFRSEKQQHIRTPSTRWQCRNCSHSACITEYKSIRSDRDCGPGSLRVFLFVCRTVVVYSEEHALTFNNSQTDAFVATRSFITVIRMRFVFGRLAVACLCIFTEITESDGNRDRAQQRHTHF